MNDFEKRQARLVLASRHNEYVAATHSKVSHLVYENLKSLMTELRRAKPIRSMLLYEPIEKYHEIDIVRIKTEFADANCQVTSKQSDAATPLDRFDCVLVPLFGFNSAKHRLGHGAGWYDKLLDSQPQAIKIGVGLKIGYIDFISESHDIAMDYIVTEGKIS